ncbi:hypothetical protein HOLleu_03299 [Holothuria leucospilota]|uniref:Uncharacterized protein n=1 Tax=Holothuria leucospilota TaxID=206669 RepID=A0A9Q1CTH0_HOLLE|nr:hypothetical protein HOLleu_03299 [Holothuria leucospilota]
MASTLKISKVGSMRLQWGSGELRYETGAVATVYNIKLGVTPPGFKILHTQVYEMYNEVLTPNATTLIHSDKAPI